MNDEDEDSCVEHTEKWIELNKINNNSSFSLDNIHNLNKTVSVGGTKIKKNKKTKRMRKSKRMRKTKRIRK